MYKNANIKLDEIRFSVDQVRWWNLGPGCVSAFGSGTPNALYRRSKQRESYRQRSHDMADP